MVSQETGIPRSASDLPPSNESKLNIRIFGLGGRQEMVRKRYTAEQIMIRLCEAEVVWPRGNQWAEYVGSSRAHPQQV